MMDCDTTGIEPDLALRKAKSLVGGGSLTIVNRSLTPALERLGYGAPEITGILAHVESTGSVLGAPGLAREHYPVFACSIGDNTVTPESHVQMVAAVQPFLSGGISKTVNLRADATVTEGRDLFVSAGRSGVKAIATTGTTRSGSSRWRRRAPRRRRPRAFRAQRPRHPSRCAASCRTTAPRARWSSGWPIARGS